MKNTSRENKEIKYDSGTLETIDLASMAGSLIIVPFCPPLGWYLFTSRMVDMGSTGLFSTGKSCNGEYKGSIMSKAIYKTYHIIKERW
jgi:hypothetical protein